ncbi:hypothetical protein [Streptosporangium sp. NPDC006007]|uniref:hypothetical protein n=1 Tax=Streptosporangium sp. NPDC006007 TaxID=3154575 RepID=UPI0033A710B5
MRKARVFSFFLITSAFVVSVAATPANAAQIASPYNGPCSATVSSCTTGSLQVGPSHKLTVEALTTVGGGNFKVIDSVNGAVIWSKGLGNFQDKYYTLINVYSSYYCTVRDAGPGAGCALFTS